MFVYSFLKYWSIFFNTWVLPHMPYIFSLYSKYLWKNSLCLEIKLTGISTIRVRIASTHNMHCMNLYMYQPLISTGLAVCDMTWCPWNTTHILCFEQSRWIKSGIKYLRPLYFNHAIYSIYMWTGSRFILKASRVETTSQLWFAIMIKMFFNCLQRNLLLSWTCTTDLCFLRTMCKALSVRFYQSLWTLRTCYVSRVTIYGVPSVSFQMAVL